MAGSFVLSFDCEGKWGMADAIGPQHDVLSESALAETYLRLVEALDQRGIRATFAFVGLFTLDHQALAGRRDQLVNAPFPVRQWLSKFLAALDAESLDGWIGRRCLGAVEESDGCHEIAAHGATHLPIDFAGVTREVFEWELGLLRQVFEQRRPRTYIFPRNREGFTDLLVQEGIEGFRSGVSQGRSISQRVRSLIGEWNIFPCSQDLTNISKPVRIPSGVFFNWRCGMRRAVAPIVTIQRLRHLVDHAERSGGVAHVWSHPHNFITGRGQWPIFEALLDRVQEGIANGRLQNLTQLEVCQAMT